MDLDDEIFQAWNSPSRTYKINPSENLAQNLSAKIIALRNMSCNNDLNDYDDDDDGISDDDLMMVTQHIPTMTKSQHGGEMSVMIKVGKCQ